jgi:hypothetical protein
MGKVRHGNIMLLGSYLKTDSDKTAAARQRPSSYNRKIVFSERFERWYL